MVHGSQKKGKKSLKTALVKAKKRIQICWCGRKCCFENILVERRWRRLKYQGVYLWA